MKKDGIGKFSLIDVKVTPNARVSEVVGWEEGRLRVRIHGIPEKGKANAALLEFLADRLGIAKSNLSIVSGTSSRIKRVRIEGIDKEELLQKLR
jgi:uncharacterized protein